MHLSGCAHQVGFACSGAASMRIYGVRSVVGTHESVMINRRNISRLLALLVAGALAMKASANGFRLADQDAFATARGEAFVATADNPSAIYYNPAGITQLEGNDLRGGIYGIYYDPSYTPTNHIHTFHSSDNLAAIPQVFCTYTPTNMPVSFGLGVYSPYGGSMSWPQNTGFRSVALNGSLTYLTINPVVAYKVLPSLSLGAGLMVNYANMGLEQGLRNSNSRQSTSSALPVTVGVWVTIWVCAGNRLTKFRLAQPSAVRRLSLWMAKRDSSGNRSYPPVNQPAQVDFKFPLTAVFGISYRPTPKWNIEFDADYTDWSSFG